LNNFTLLDDNSISCEIGTQSSFNLKQYSHDIMFHIQQSLLALQRLYEAHQSCTNQRGFLG